MEFLVWLLIWGGGVMMGVGGTGLWFTCYDQRGWRK